MKISADAWNKYKNRLSLINHKAAAEFTRHFVTEGGGYQNFEAADIVAYAYALATKYGEAAAAQACNMYDATAAAQNAKVPAAEPAATATYAETAKAIYGTLGTGNMPGAVSRLVKQAGADTALKNARRDGAQFAWIPQGDTCAFCIMLASNGWQYMSSRALSGGHAEHIHANCDCEYAVRFDTSSTVSGYDPGRYREMYRSAEGSTSAEKVNSMRRALNEDGLASKEKDGNINIDTNRASGAISGGRDPDSEAANAHAELYYEEIRKRNSDVPKIAASSGFSENEIQEIKDYVFNEEHDLGEGKVERFASDYMMAESWRRLQEGTPEPHDLTLLKHEKMERELVLRGYSQDEAHIMTSRRYNYSKEANEFYDKAKKHPKKR